MNSARPYVAMAAMSLVTLVAARDAVAGVVSWDDRAAFEGAFGPDLAFESFENREIGALALRATFENTGLAVDVFGGLGIDAIITDGMAVSVPSDGIQHLVVGFGFFDYEVSFETPEDVFAFGFDLSGYQDKDGSGTFEVRLLNDGVEVGATSLTATPVQEGGFRAISSTIAFDQIIVTVEDGDLIGGTADIVGFDGITYAVVPGPGAVALLALAGVTGRRRRRF